MEKWSPRNMQLTSAFGVFAGGAANGVAVVKDAMFSLVSGGVFAKPCMCKAMYVRVLFSGLTWPSVPAVRGYGRHAETAILGAL
jgi:hypothetical protein